MSIFKLQEAMVALTFTGYLGLFIMYIRANTNGILFIFGIILIVSFALWGSRNLDLDKFLNNKD